MEKSSLQTLKNQLIFALKKKEYTLFEIICIIMKKIEAVIQNDKQKAVIDALVSQGVGGLTVTRSLGRGAGERPRIGGKKGDGKIFVSTIDNAFDIFTKEKDSKAL